MSGPALPSIGRAVNANHDRESEYAAVWPTSATPWAISRVPPAGGVTSMDPVGDALTRGVGDSVGGADGVGGDVGGGDAVGAVDGLAELRMGDAVLGTLGDGDGLGEPFGAAASSEITATVPGSSVEGELTTMSRLPSSPSPKTACACWSIVTGRASTGSPLSHGFVASDGHTSWTVVDFTCSCPWGPRATKSTVRCATMIGVPTGVAEPATEPTDVDARATSGTDPEPSSPRGVSWEEDSRPAMTTTARAVAMDAEGRAMER